MNIEQERKAFEEKFPIPENCIWCGDGYAPTEFHAWEAKRCAQMFVGWLARARLQHQESGWMPIECDGRRNIPYPLDTMIDIQIEDGTIFYGLMRGDVCVDEKKPDPLRFGYFDMELSAYMERWFGVVTHYRLHERKGNEQG